MLDHDQLTPEEAQEQYQPLIQHLQSYYDTHTEDNASLARIRTRLMQKTAASLPIADDRMPLQAPIPLRPERNTRMKFVRSISKDRPWFSTLVAAVLLVVLVASFALVLHLWQSTTAGPPLKHGWSLVASFSGTGSKTITGQHLDVGHKYGVLITCNTTSDVRVKFEDGNALDDSQCTPLDIAKPLGPGADLTSPTPFAPLQKIEVTTNITTSWQLFILKGTYYPPLSIDTTNWRNLLLNELSGTGNTTSAIGNNTTVPKNWGLQFVCHGTGNIKISIQSDPDPNTPAIVTTTAPCDGQPNFDASEAVGQGKVIRQVQITTNDDNEWQAVLVSCANNKPHCGITITTPAP